MRAVVAIAATELRRFLRDRSNIFFVFIFPLLLVMLVGAQFGSGSGGGRVVLTGPDSALQQQVADRLGDAGVTVSSADPAAADELLARGRADVGLTVTDEAAAAYDAGQDLEVEMTLSSANGAVPTSQQVRTVLSAIQLERGQVAALVAAGAEEESARAALAATAEGMTAPDVAVTDTDRIAQEFAGVSGFSVGAAGQVLLFVFLISLAGSATLIQSRKYGVVARTLAAPVSATRLVLGEALGRWVVAMVQGLYIMGGTALLFDVQWGNFALAVLVLAVFAVVAAGAGMLIGSVFDNDSAASGAGVGVALVLAAIGGCMLPLELFPDGLRAVANATPHAWAYQALAEIQRHAGTLADIAGNLAVLLGFAVVLLALGSWALRRSLARAI